MGMWYKVIIIFSFLFSFSHLSATIIEEADSAYNAKDFHKAIAAYEKIEEEQGTSPELLYNLGNAYYELSDYGKAMLCYERAFKLNPSSDKIRENLIFLKNKVEDANRAEQKGKKVSVSPDEMTFFQSMHNAIAVEIHSDRWAVWGVVAFFLFLVCVALYIFTSRVLFRKIGFFGGFICLGMTIICIIFGYIGASEFNKREDGVIVSFKTALQTEPGDEKDNKEGKVLTKGTKVRIIAEETDASGKAMWYKVRLNSNYIGWVTSNYIEII